MSSDKPSPPPIRLTVLSANLHVAAGVPVMPENGLPKAVVTANLEKAAGLIERLRPDVVLLQEVDFKARRTAFVDQGAFLARRLKMYLARAVTFDTVGAKAVLPEQLKDCRYGLAVLSRIKPVETAVHRLPGAASPWPVEEKRVLLTVRLPLENGASIAIANTHLEFNSQDVRKEQLEAVASLLPADGWIVGGDFNEPYPPPEPAGSIPARLRELHRWGKWRDDKNAWPTVLGPLSLEKVTPEPTYPADEPVVAIDHIFAAGRAKVIEIVRIDSRGVSDHHFVCAVVEVAH